MRPVLSAAGCSRRNRRFSPMSDDLNPVDRDAMIRTVIGEAGNQGPEGQAAVAQSIMNRVVSGRYGNSPAAVVLAPGQYEPWQTRRQELLSYSPNSPAYQKAGQHC